MLATDRWSARALVTIETLERYGEAELPRDLTVDVVAFSTRADPYVARIPVSPELVHRLLIETKPVTLTVPFELVAGPVEWTLIVSDGTGRLRFGAVRRYDLTWPTRRELRRRGLWMPARQVRVRQARDLLLPQLEGRFRSGRDAFFLGLWCARGGSPRLPALLLSSKDEQGAEPIPVQLVETGTVDLDCRTCGRCARLYGRPRTPPDPGRWVLAFAERPARGPHVLAEIVVEPSVEPATARRSPR